MPADVLEKPTTVEDAPRQISTKKSVAVEDGAPTAPQTASETDELSPTSQQIESVLRKIFEGYEEFLGCTPD
jgi:hypothetical protein